MLTNVSTFLCLSACWRSKFTISRTLRREEHVLKSEKNINEVVCFNVSSKSK